MIDRLPQLRWVVIHVRDIAQRAHCRHIQAQACITKQMPTCDPNRSHGSIHTERALKFLLLIGNRLVKLPDLVITITAQYCHSTVVLLVRVPQLRRKCLDFGLQILNFWSLEFWKIVIAAAATCTNPLQLGFIFFKVFIKFLFDSLFIAIVLQDFFSVVLGTLSAAKTSLFWLPSG